MSFQKLLSVSILMISIIILCGCTEGPTGPAGNDGAAGPVLTGNLVGFAYLMDLNGVLLTDHSGITVNALDSNGSAAATATTAATGRYVLAGLSTGTYTYTWGKATYGTQQLFGQQFVGGGDAFFENSKTLVVLPSFYVDSLTANISTSQTGIEYRGVLTGTLPTGGTSMVRAFVGTAATVSGNPANYIYTKRNSITSGGTILGTSILVSALKAETGLTTGAVVYLVVYAEGAQTRQYADPATGRDFYPNIGTTASAVVSVTLP